MTGTIADYDGQGEFLDISNLTSRQRRKLKRRGIGAHNIDATTNAEVRNSLTLKKIDPITKNQRKAFDAYYNNKHLANIGVAGSGKSFIALWLALNEVQNGKSQKKRVVIVRSAVQGRAIGFLPGNSKEKMKMFESPYISICSKLFGRSDAYEILKKKGEIEFESTSFLRGETFENCVLIFDEMQNASFEELQTVLTRAGENTKVILCGDFGQNDLIYSKYDQSGLARFMNVIKRMSEFEIVTYKIEDIVRSGLVKSFYVALAKEDEFVCSQKSSTT